MTDAKVIKREGLSRKFGYIGFPDNATAKQAMESLQDTYIDTSRISLEYAYPQNDANLPRPWSRHTIGSSASGQDMPEEAAKPVHPSKAEAERKQKFKEFVDLMMEKSSRKTGKKDGKIGTHSWNESFENFTPQKALSKKERRKL